MFLVWLTDYPRRLLADIVGRELAIDKPLSRHDRTLWFAYLGCLGRSLIHALVFRLLAVPDVPEVNGVRVPVPGQGELPASWCGDFDFGGIDLPWRRIRRPGR